MNWFHLDTDLRILLGEMENVVVVARAFDPSSSTLQELVDICADLAISHFIIFNEKNTVNVFRTKLTEWFICTYSLP